MRYLEGQTYPITPTYNLYKGKMADQEFVRRYVDALQQLGVPEKPPSG